MSYPDKMYTPQKELNQVKKTRYFRIYNPFKTETMLITLDFWDFFSYFTVSIEN